MHIIIVMVTSLFRRRYNSKLKFILWRSSPPLYITLLLLSWFIYFFLLSVSITHRDLTTFRLIFIRECTITIIIIILTTIIIIIDAGCATMLSSATRFYHASWGGRGVCVEELFDIIIKLWLRFRSRHLVLWSLRTYGLRQSE